MNNAAALTHREGMIDLRNARRIDCNPARWRLPAEVTARRRQVKKGAEPPGKNEVKVDAETALSLKPKNRIKWLTTALEMVKDGKADSRDLFDIIINRGFSAGSTMNIGKQLCFLAHENSFLFSEKQERHILSPEFLLNAKFGPASTSREEALSESGSPPRERRSSADATPLRDASPRRQAKAAPVRDGSPRRQAKATPLRDASPRRQRSPSDTRSRFEAPARRRADLSPLPRGDRSPRNARDRSPSRGREYVDLSPLPRNRFLQDERGRSRSGARRRDRLGRSPPPRERSGSRGRDRFGRSPPARERSPPRSAVERSGVRGRRDRERAAASSPLPLPRKGRSPRAVRERSADAERSPRVVLAAEDESADEGAPGFREVTEKLGRAQLEQQEREEKQKQKQEEEADSSLQLLEKLTKPREEPPVDSGGPVEAALPGRRRRRRHTDRSRSRGAVQRRSRAEMSGRSRRSCSRSVSIQAASPSRSPTPARERKASFEHALQRRLAQREGADTSRTAITWSREDLRSGRHRETRMKWLTTYQQPKGFTKGV